MAEERRTRQVRTYEDIADMLAWINEIEGENVADIIDPLIRDGVTARFDRIRPTVDAIKAAKAKHRETVTTASSTPAKG